MITKFLGVVLPEIPKGKYLIVSHNQVDTFQPGYTGWDIKSFRELLSDDVVLERDHGFDLRKLKEDCKYCDIIHIDPFKNFQTIEETADYTSDIIQTLFQINEKCQYEISTEQSVFKMTEQKLNSFVDRVLNNLTPKYRKTIKYLVVQANEKLDLVKGRNVGTLDLERCIKQVYIAKKNGLLPKQHNCDFLPESDIHIREMIGVESINVAPEIARQYLSELIVQQKIDVNKVYLLLKSNSNWTKWTDEYYDPGTNILEFVQAFGHYVLYEYIHQYGINHD